MGKGFQKSNNRGSAQQQDLIRRFETIGPIPITVTKNGTDPGFGSVLLPYRLHKGSLALLGSAFYMTFNGAAAGSNLTANWSGSYAVGTVPAPTFGDVSGFDEGFFSYGTSGVGPATGKISNRALNFGGVNTLFNGYQGEDGNVEVWLNLLIDPAGMTNNSSVNLNISGDISQVYAIMGP